MSLLDLLGKKTKTEKKEEKPLFNIEINIDGQQGPFKSFDYFLYIAKTADRVSKNYIGSFSVTDNRRLIRCVTKGLHTYRGEIDLEETPAFGVYHVHHHHGIGVSDIIHENGNIFLSHIFDEEPIYTLQGLYNSLPNQKINTKINALLGSLENHTNYEFNSIATKKETRLKLLENAYRRLISNQ